MISGKHEALLILARVVRSTRSAFFIGQEDGCELLCLIKKAGYLQKLLSAHDAHYGGNLVDGARMLGLFGDVATELLIQHDGDEGLFCAYDNVEFLNPVYAGDYIEAVGEITSVGNTSRKMKFEARKVIAPRPDINDSACDVLPEPVIVCRATGTCVVPKDKQRRK